MDVATMVEITGADACATLLFATIGNSILAATMPLYVPSATCGSSVTEGDAGIPVRLVMTIGTVLDALIAAVNAGVLQGSVVAPTWYIRSGSQVNCRFAPAAFLIDHPSEKGTPNAGLEVVAKLLK